MVWDRDWSTSVRREVEERPRPQAGVLALLCVPVLIIFTLCVTNIIPVRDTDISSVTVEKGVFGTTKEGQEVSRYRLKNKNGMTVDVLDLGVTLAAVHVPDKNGVLSDVILGYDNVAGYETTENPYFGAMVGRVIGRIKDAQFTLEGHTYNLSKNDGENHIHGGTKGWSMYVWEAKAERDHVIFTHYSPDGDENYPGDVTVRVSLQLTDDNQIVVDVTAESPHMATPINVGWHPYFNLAGEGSGDIYDHEVTIHANKYIPTRSDLIPTGEIADVTGCDCDFRKPTLLRTRVRDVPDILKLFVTDYQLRGPDGKRLAARVSHGDSGRRLEVYTNQPGVVFYTSDYVNVTGGKQGHSYGAHSGFCLETQNNCDAINNPGFPDSVLRPGSTYYHQMWFKFSTFSEN